MQRLLSKAITSGYRHNCAQTQLSCLLPPRLGRYNYRPRYGFAIEAPKQVDMTKQSIKLLSEPLKVEVSVETLGRTYQLSTFGAIRLLDFAIDKMCMWQVVSAIRNYNYLWIQQPNSLNKLLQRLAQFHNPLQYPSFNLNTLQHMQQFLQLVQYMQQRTHHNFNRMMLSLLTKYLENYFQIDGLVYLQIAEHLTSRAYVPESVMRSLRNYKFQDELKAIRGRIWGPTAGRIGVTAVVKEFRTVMYYVGIVTNLKHCQDIGLQLGSPLVEPRVRDLLIETFFMFLQDPQIMPFLLANTPPSQLLNPKLFPQHKSTYISIIKKILTPLIFRTTKFHSKLLNTIFDRLLIYTQLTKGDRDIVIEILERFSLCIRYHAGSGFNGIMETGDGQDQPRDYGSLVMLCEKFGYYQQELFYYLVVGYIKPQLSTYLGQFHNWNYSQFLYMHNHILKTSVQLITLLQLSNSQNFSLTQTMQQILHKNLQQITQHTQKFRSFTTSIISNITIEQMRDRIVKPQDHQIYFSQVGEYYTGENLIQKVKVAEKIEKEYGVKLNMQVLTDFSYPVDFNHCPAARIKGLYTIQRYYRQFSKYRKLVSQIDNILCTSTQILQVLKNNISFPGLLQSAYLYYYTKPQSANQQHIQIQTFNQNQSKSNQELIKLYLQQIRNRMSNKLIDVLSNQQKDIERDRQFVPVYCKNLEFLNQSIGFRVSKYGRSQRFQADFANYKIIHNIKKYQKLKLKTIQQFKSLLRDKILGPKTRGFSNFVDFPFISNFLIIQNNVQYPIFFVDAALKQKYESRLSSKQESKQIPQQKQKQKIVKVSSIEELTLAIRIKKKQSSSIEKKHIKSFTQDCIDYFAKNSKVILISNQEDIKNIAGFILDKNRKI